MTKDYLLGLTTIPAIVVAIAALWGIGLGLSKLGADIVNRLKPRRPRQRALSAAIVACARTTWFVRLPFDCVAIFAAGHEMSNGDEIADAVANVIDARPAPSLPRVKVSDGP